MTVDQETQRLIALLRSKLPIIGSVTAAEFREVQAQIAALAPKGPDLARVEDIMIDTRLGSLPARLYVPIGSPAGIILYVHGGGWTIGSIASSDHTVRVLAERTSCFVVSIDYRLAPEHPFPAAVEDVMLAVQWIAQQRSQIAGYPIPLIVAGDSAGANLSAVASILMRDSKGPSIAAQILIYPSTRGDIDAPALQEFDAPFLRGARSNGFLINTFRIGRSEQTLASRPWRRKIFPACLRHSSSRPKMISCVAKQRTMA